MCEITTDFLSMDFDKWSSDAISVGVHLLSQESQSAFLMEKNLRHRFSGLFVNLDLWKDFLCKLCILNPLHLPGVSRNKTERNTGVAWFPRACFPKVAFMKGEAAPRQPDGSTAALPSEYASQTSCADTVPSLWESQNLT